MNLPSVGGLMTNQSKPRTLKVPAQFQPAFGYKVWWLAIRTSNGDAVARSLHLHNVQGIATARDAFARIYKDWMTASLVMTTQNGWALVMFPPSAANEAQIRRLLEPLSNEFAEAQWYTNVRTSSCYGWARATQGQMVRAFEYGDGECIFNVGNRTPEEVAAGVGSQGAHIHNEDDVIAIAEAWSLNPLKLTQEQIRGPLIGEKSRL